MDLYCIDTFNVMDGFNPYFLHLFIHRHVIHHVIHHVIRHVILRNIRKHSGSGLEKRGVRGARAPAELLTREMHLFCMIYFNLVCRTVC